MSVVSPFNLSLSSNYAVLFYRIEFVSTTYLLLEIGVNPGRARSSYDFGKGGKSADGLGLFMWGNSIKKSFVI